jgi:hypothetical protein
MKSFSVDSKYLVTQLDMLASTKIWDEMAADEQLHIKLFGCTDTLYGILTLLVTKNVVLERVDVM